MATIGTKTVGSSTDAFPSNYLFGSKFTAPETGTLSVISAWLDATVAGNAIGAVYADNAGQPSNRLAQSAQVPITTGAKQVNFTLTTSVNVVAGSSYWLAVFSGTNNLVTFIAVGTANQGFYDTYNTFPSLASQSYPDALSTEVYTIWSDYSGTVLPLTVSITATPPTSITGPANVSFTATASGGTPPYTYQWKDRTQNIGSPTTNPQTAISFPQVTEITQVQIHVTVTDSLGATADSGEIVVTVNPQVVNPYTLTLLQATGGTISSPQTSYAPGTTATITMSGLLPNYQLTGWTRNGVGYDAASNPLSFVMDANYTVQAVFTYVPPSGGVTFGNSTIGGNVSGGLPVNYVFGTRFTPTQSGTINKVFIYTDATDAGFAKAGIFSDNNGAPLSKLSESSEVAITSGAKWVEFPLITPVAVVAGTYYWLSGFSGTNNLHPYSSTGATGQSYLDTFSVYPTWDDTAYPDAFAAEMYSIYATGVAAPPTPPTVTISPTSAAITTEQTQVFTATVTSSGTGATVTWIDDSNGTTLGTGLTYTFPVSPAGTYSIHASVTDSNGSGVSPSATITVTEPVTVINGTTNQSFELPAGTYEITMPAQATVNGTTYNFLQWENNSTNPVRTVVLSANATVTATYTASVPTLTASPNGPYTPHINTSQYFSGSASGGLPPYSWLWNFGDGSTSTLQNPSHTYTTAGTYTVSLQVSDSNTPQAVTTVYTTATVAALLPPVASFTATPTSVLTGQTVTFNGTSSHAQEAGATITSYQWNFGDGNTGTGATATHVYSITGSMNVVLTVTDSLGLTDTETVIVTVSPPPNWSLTVLPSTGGSTSWTGTRTYPSGQPSDPITATRNTNNLFTRWLLDGNDVGTANPITVASQTAGTTHTIQPQFSPAPTLTAEASGPYSAHITSPTVQFAGSASGGVPPYRTWAWTFGDGGVSATQNPSHTYATAGTYSITLQVIDTDGNMASDSTTVTISNYYPPTAIISNVNPLNPYVGQTVTFNGSGSYLGEPPPTTITEYAWDFGDGATASGAVVTHQFANARTYIVKLTVTDSNGMMSSTTFNITANAKPQRTFIVQLGPNGSSNPGAGTYYQDYDIAFTVTAQPIPHYKLLNWNVNGVLSTELTQVIPASATPASGTFTLTASFEAIVWTLDVSAGVNGTIIGTPSGQYIDGTPITESAKPDEGNIYDYWMINGVRDDLNPQSLIMDKDYTMRAYFKPIPTYSVAGTVKDATGTPVMEVRVSAVGTAYSTYTIADGSYVLEVPNGNYTIAFEKAGYNTVSVPNVSVTGNVIIAPVTISSTPTLAGFPWYVILIGAGAAGVYFITRGTKRRSR